MRNHGHPYVFACALPTGHGGEHELHAAHRLLWEARQGVPVPAHFVLRPRNGDWRNLDEDNWELVTWRRLQRELVVRKRVDVTHKSCAECSAMLPLSAFEKRRNLCRECWLDRLRSNEKKRRGHVDEFRCVIYQGRHYHLLDKETARLYCLTLFFDELRESSPTEGAYRRTVAHLKKKLHIMVESQERA